MVELEEARRDVLLAARQNIVRELDQLCAIRAPHWGGNGSSNFKYRSTERLRGMLLEIDLELAHSQSNKAGN